MNLNCSNVKLCFVRSKISILNLKFWAILAQFFLRLSEFRKKNWANAVKTIIFILKILITMLSIKKTYWIESRNLMANCFFSEFFGYFTMFPFFTMFLIFHFQYPDYLKFALFLIVPNNCTFSNSWCYFPLFSFSVVILTKPLEPSTKPIFVSNVQQEHNMTILTTFHMFSRTSTHLYTFSSVLRKIAHVVSPRNWLQMFLAYSFLIIQKLIRSVILTNW